MNEETAEMTVSLATMLFQNPWFWGAVFIFILLIGASVIIGILKTKVLRVKNFQIDFTQKESIKAAESDKTEITKIRKTVEESTRYIIHRQMGLVRPFLQSLRPIFSNIVYNILFDAVNDSLGVAREERKVLKPHVAIKDQGSNTYYVVEEVKTYHHDFRTRTFTNLVDSEVDSLLSNLELEIYKMLVSNNIGTDKESVRTYVKSREENLIGIIRNTLCTAYNSMCNKNLFDTHAYWQLAGITYPEDWISDKIYQLLKNCMMLRYEDFVD